MTVASCILSMPQARTKSLAESSLIKLGRCEMGETLGRPKNSSVCGTFLATFLTCLRLGGAMEGSLYEGEEEMGFLAAERATQVQNARLVLVEGVLSVENASDAMLTS